VDYLTIIQNTPFFHWQTELLIESFKLLNMQDNLVIGVVPSNKKSLVCTKNLKDHKRKFQSDKYPSDFLPINQAYLTYVALKKEIIKQPFALIHSDTIIVQPLNLIENNISFSVNPFILQDFKKFDKILPLGGICQFNDVPIIFFERVMYNTNQLINKLDADLVNRAAWMQTLAEYNAKGKVEGIPIEVKMWENLTKESSFIHYSKGYPPFFNKKMFSFNFNFSMSADNVFNVLENPENDITTSTHYIQQLIKLYKK
jgi:hypothetical protein